MSMTIQLEPQAEEILRLRAQQAGLSLEDFVRSILAREAAVPRSYHPRVVASLRIFDSYRGKLGPVPEGALDPEALYGGS